MQLRYFKIEDFKCKEGQEYPDPYDLLMGFDPFMLAMVDEIRHRCGFPIRINSGYRNEEYNNKIGGAEKSQHRYGKAADISAWHNSDERFKVLRQVAEEIHPGGLGLYYKDRFVHIDTRRIKTRWYGQGG